MKFNHDMILYVYITYECTYMHMDKHNIKHDQTYNIDY